MTLFDDDNAVMKRYVELYGPIPDARAMSNEDALLIPDKAREGLQRGRRLTLREWGVPDDIPANVTI